MRLFAKPSLRADAEAIASSDQSEGRPVALYNGARVPPQPFEIDEAVDSTQNVVGSNMVVQTEPVNRPSCITSRSPIIDGASNSPRSK
jgi:hypothetical protein